MAGRNLARGGIGHRSQVSQASISVLSRTLRDLTLNFFSYRIIRRRIAWLVGNWVGEDLSHATRSKIYGLLVHLMGRNESTDTAIRLTAARSLGKCDTWDFDKDSFVPFLPAAIEEIVSLLGEVELSDSRMRLNQSLGVVIDRVGIHVSSPSFTSELRLTDPTICRSHLTLPNSPKSWQRFGTRRKKTISKLRS